jgi:hypothetical protein
MNRKLQAFWIVREELIGNTHLMIKQIYHEAVKGKELSDSFSEYYLVPNATVQYLNEYLDPLIRTHQILTTGLRIGGYEDTGNPFDKELDALFNLYFFLASRL